MDPILISVEGFSQTSYLLSLVAAMVLAIILTIVMADRLAKRKRKVVPLLILGAAMALSVASVAVSSNLLVSNAEAHTTAQMDSIDSQLTEEFGFPVEIHGEGVLSFVRFPGSYGEHGAMDPKLFLSYEMADERYWLSIEPKRVAMDGSDYSFELYMAGEPLPVNDFVENLELPPLTVDSLIPAEDKSR